MIQSLPPTPAGRILLKGVSWATYQELRSRPGNRNLRMTFDHGVLEVVSPSKLHERIGRLICDFIFVWTQKHKIPRHSCGALTLQDEEDFGGEPDACYYFHNVEQLQQRDDFDLGRDGPPDLVVEVDVTSLSDRRLPLYQSIGVAEIWRWRNNDLTVLRKTEAEEYDEPSTTSAALPDFPINKAAELLRRRHRESENALMDEFLALIGKKQ